MNPLEVDSDEDDNSVSEQGETNKNPATVAIIWKHRIATIAQNKNFVSNTFFDDSSDSSDGNDYMETRLNADSKVYGFVLSQTHQLIRVHTTVFIAFPTVHTNTLRIRCEVDFPSLLTKF